MRLASLRAWLAVRTYPARYRAGWLSTPERRVVADFQDALAQRVSRQMMWGGAHPQRCCDTRPSESHMRSEALAALALQRQRVSALTHKVSAGAPDELRLTLEDGAVVLITAGERDVVGSLDLRLDSQQCPAQAREASTDL